MRLKLTREKAEGLYRILAYMLENYNPENIAESLVEELVRRIYVKLRSRLEAKYTKEYSLVLSSIEAKAYHVFIMNWATIEGFDYEKNLVQNHCAEIDRIYG